MIASRLYRHLLARPSLVRSNCPCALHPTGDSIIPDVMCYRVNMGQLLSSKKKQPEREAHSASPSHPRSATTAVPTAASRRSSSPAGYGSFPRQPRTRNPNPNPATMMPQSEKGRREQDVPRRRPPTTTAGRTRFGGGEEEERAAELGDGEAAAAAVASRRSGSAVRR